MKSNRIVTALLALILANPLLITMLTIGSVALPNVVAPQPAAAAWWDNVTGVYIKVRGRTYYFGDYVNNPQPVFNGGTWEVKCGNSVCAHGYSQTISPAIWWVASRLPRR
jgi:hypothetical protein